MNSSIKMEREKQVSGEGSHLGYPLPSKYERLNGALETRGEKNRTETRTNATEIINAAGFVWIRDPPCLGRVGTFGTFSTHLEKLLENGNDIREVLTKSNVVI